MYNIAVCNIICILKSQEAMHNLLNIACQHEHKQKMERIFSKDNLQLINYEMKGIEMSWRKLA